MLYAVLYQLLQNTINAIYAATMIKKTLPACLIVLLLALCIDNASAAKAPKFGQGEIEFSVANQQFFITDKTFDIQFRLTSGSPDQIRFQPSREAMQNGLTISTDWRYFDFANMSELSFDRPAGIKPGDYECELSLRNSSKPEDMQSIPLLISVVQIEFDMDRKLIVCGDEQQVTIQLRDVEGRPNIVKISTNHTADKSVIHETSWMPFDIFEPFVTIDLSKIPNGKILTDAVRIDLADSTTRENNKYVASASQSIWQIGRGDSNKFIETRFNDCMVLVDNTESDSKAKQSYQWYKDGELIDDATDRFYYETDEYGNMIPLNGTYSVDITDAKGNKTLICPQSFASQTLVPYRKSNIIAPKPNDTDQKATLHIGHSLQNLENTIVRIYDLDGNLAYIIVGVMENNTLPILPPKEYVVVIEGPRYKETLKYIVN